MSDAKLRRQLIQSMSEAQAYVTFEEAVANMPADKVAIKPNNVPHSPWRLLEHLRLALADIWGFCHDASHVSPPFPQGYWPQGDGPQADQTWDKCVAAYLEDRTAMQQYLADEGNNLFAPIPHGEGQTLLREALLVIDHQAYHVGQLIVVRRALNCWAKD